MAYLKISGEVGYEITLYSVVSAVQELKNKIGELSALQIDITSEGGSSVEGRQIYEYLKGLNIPVHMNAVNYVCSAGFTIFMAGSRRTAQDNATELLMHSPFYAPDLDDWFMGISSEDADEIKQAIIEEKKKLSNIYSDILGIEKETIKSLMDSNQFMNTETALKLGVISEVLVSEVEKPTEFNIAAKWYVSKKHESLIKNHTKMENKELKNLTEKVEKQETFLSKIWNMLKKQIKNLSIASDEGQTLEIEGDVLEVGVTVTNVTDGVFTVMYADKKWTVTVAGSVVTDLVEIVEEPQAEDVEALKTENSNLKTEIEELKRQLQNKVELENKVKANEEYIEKLRSFTTKYQKEDGSFDFSGSTSVGSGDANKRDGKTIAAEIKNKKKE